MLSRPTADETGAVAGALAPWIIGALIVLAIVVTVGLFVGFVLSGARRRTGVDGEPQPVVLSPYNAALLDEIQEQVAAYRSGGELTALQSFVAARVGLFENDRSGIRDATLVLEGELDSIRFASTDERGDAMRLVDAYLTRFDPPTGSETPLR